MTSGVRNRLLGLGVVWGLLLAIPPAFVMTDPYELNGILVAGVLCAVVSGAVGTLAAGRRAARGRESRRTILAGLGTGLYQGLVVGGVAALLFWVIMAVTLSGFALDDPVELSTLMRPQVFLGSFFVALSVFIYVVVAGVLLGPAFGILVNRAARAGAKGEQ